MASAVVATCGMCGIAITSANSNSLFSGSRLQRALHNHVSQRLSVSRSSRIQATSSDQGGDEKEKKEKKEEVKTSFFTSITDALDFAQTRSEKDAELLADARDATQSGEQMNREQYAALRRKIGGTYKDFFKDSIDVIGDYVDDGWVDKTCRVCKKDTSNDPRTKDSLGRYAHVACLENEKSGNFFSRLFGK